MLKLKTMFTGLFAKKNGVVGTKIENKKNSFPQPLPENKLTNFPDLMEYWDYEKNDVTPDEVTVGSNKKTNWKCSCGNEWSLEVSNMKKRKYKCQECKKH